jgi:PAS domain S-box-containing protein
VAWEVDETAFRLLAENSADVIWFKSVSPDAFLYVSPAFARIWGVSLHALQGNPALWDEMIHPEDREAVQQALQRWLASETQDFLVEHRLLRPNGDVRWIRNHGLTLSRKDGKPYQLGGIARDITAQVAAASIQQHLAAVVESSDDAIITLDLHGRVTSWNTGAETVFGYTANEMVGQSVSILRPPEAADDESIFRRYIAEGKRIQHYETRRKHKVGRIIDISLTMSPLIDAAGRITGFSKISRDVTERKIAERIIEKLTADLERRVAERTADLHRANTDLKELLQERRRMEEELLHISEREQRRIGQDIHDDLGQQLAGARMIATVLARSMATKSPADEATATSVVQHLEAAVDTARRLCRGLHPVSPELGGLARALEELSQRASKNLRVKCKFTMRGSFGVEDQGTATHLYRIAQESLNNALRHGHARTISIQMRGGKGRLKLLIEDDGIGLPAPSDDAVPHTGMGLRIMHYRAELMGGQLNIKPLKPSGTRVTCDIPLPQTY